MLIRNVTLWPWPLTLWPWKFVVYQVSRVQRLYEMLVKLSNPRLNYWWFRDFCTVMSRCDLYLLPLDLEPLQNFGCHVCKLGTKTWAKSNNPQLSYWRLSTFLPCRFSVMRGPNISKLGEDIRRSWLHKKFVSEFGYLPACLNASCSNLSDVENDTKLPLFDFPPYENLGRSGRDLYTNCWSSTYYRTSEIHLMAIHCAAAERVGLIKKLKEKVSSWVKQKAWGFPTYWSGHLKKRKRRTFNSFL